MQDAENDMWRPLFVVSDSHDDKCKYLVKFLVNTAVSTNTAVSWIVVPCSLVEVDRRFRGAYCLHQGDGLTRSKTPQDRHLHNCQFSLLLIDYT